MLPGVRVHDAYVAGEGILHASLFGLIPLVNLRGTGEVTWLPPAGPLPCRRGPIEQVDYAFAR